MPAALMRQHPQHILQYDIALHLHPHTPLTTSTFLRFARYSSYRFCLTPNYSTIATHFYGRNAFIIARRACTDIASNRSALPPYETCPHARRLGRTRPYALSATRVRTTSLQHAANRGVPLTRFSSAAFEFPLVSAVSLACPLPRHCQCYSVRRTPWTSVGSAQKMVSCHCSRPSSHRSLLSSLQRGSKHSSISHAQTSSICAGFWCPRSSPVVLLMNRHCVESVWNETPV